MSDTTVSAAPPVEVDPGIDLSAVEETRLGLKIAGLGILCVMLTVPGVPGFEPLLVVLRALGWLMLGAGFLIAAPTPDGPLPRWLALLYACACVFAALRIAKNVVRARVGFGEPQWIERIETGLVIALIAAFLALPWILWRFCQYRGLTGRALSWLWSAFLLAAVFVAHWKTRVPWIVWTYPALGILLFALARQTARDVWLDAVNRRAKTVVRSAT